MSSSRLVYSSSGDNTCPVCRKPLHKCSCHRKAPTTGASDGIVRIRRETSGRGGKEVTVIDGLSLPDTELKALAKRLKTACGSGGAIKDGRVEIQGDKRETVSSMLRKAGYEVRLSGG